MAHAEIATRNTANFLKRFESVRNHTLKLVEPLEVEDFVVQPVMDVSPPKWHLAHTTWFFEVFILKAYQKDYQLFDKQYPFLFNSYYVSAGDRWSRAERGHLTRPTVKQIMAYRKSVDDAMGEWLSTHELTDEQAYVMEIGLQHEQQHQELLVYDIKYILGHNPLYPVYKSEGETANIQAPEMEWLPVEKGNYRIGHEGKGFCFDNEKGSHEVHLEAFSIGSRLITNGEFLAFINDGGYENHMYWLSEGWDWVKQQVARHPMYWVREDSGWMHYTLGGLKKLSMDEPVSHVSFFEADAFAKWRGCRLPTEQEWEVAAQMYGNDVIDGQFVDEMNLKPIQSGSRDFFGNLWEWTASAYEPYPFYQAPEGALGEYNGKFMVNQKVLRGGSYATSRNHIRLTYRNFFHPHLQWLCNGIRLAKH